jgi:CBS-domain-containing membrane protein
MKQPLLARDIMATQVVTLSPTADVLDGIAHLLKHQVTGSPVVDQDRTYLGVFSEKCCMRVLMTIAANAGRRDVQRKDLPRAEDIMVQKLVTLKSEMDVFEAIGILLKHRISGAPVLDDAQQFLGVFSEKGSMSVILAAFYEGLPTSLVGAFVDTDPNRIVDGRKDLLSIAQIFSDTPYRRLPILRQGRLVGQISRRDVIRAAHVVSKCIPSPEEALRDRKPPGSRESEYGSSQVSGFMDTAARTVDEETSLLSIAQTFLQTPYRRLPVLSAGKLVGLITRRDLLQVAYDAIKVTPLRAQSLLYLSSLIDASQAPV